MRTIIITLVLITFTTSAAAFNGNSGMQGIDMKNLAAKMGEMEACMKTVDQKALQQLQTRGEAVAEDVEALCSKGKRDQAQQKAVEFAKEVRNSPVLAKIRECGKIVSMAQTMPPAFNTYKNTDFDNRHICDVR